jgi:large subunit ribosomal protein L9
MKIVLREDVEKLGHRGDVVKVAAGYGRNYLLPKKLAYEATPGNLKVIAHEKRAKDLRDAKVRNDYQALANVISGLSFTIPKKVGENDLLFGSVTSAEIADLLASKGIEVDKRRISLDESIKNLGSHSVAIKLHKDVTANLAIEVVKEE